MKTDFRNSKVQYFHNLAEGWDEMVGNNRERAAKIGGIFSGIEIKPGDNVLDVGSGNGILLRFIEEKTGTTGRITALDAAPGMIEKARDIHRQYDNIDYVTGFIEDAELPLREYDVIMCYAVLPHVDDIPASLRRMNSLLKEGGRLYIFHPASTRDLNDFHSGLESPVKHDMLPEEGELRELLSSAGFSVRVYKDEPGLNFVECLR